MPKRAEAVLVLNAGSSSVKFSLYTDAQGDARPRLRGQIEGLQGLPTFIARDADRELWYFDVSGAFTSTRGGLLRTDTVWKTLGRAYALRGLLEKRPLVFLTTDLPRKGSEGDLALRSAGDPKTNDAFFDVIEMRSADGYERLRKYAAGANSDKSLPGFW